jgi:hypothetical protein
MPELTQPFYKVNKLSLGSALPERTDEEGDFHEQMKLLLVEHKLITPVASATRFEANHFKTSLGIKVKHVFWLGDLERISSNPVDYVPPRGHAAGI